MTKLHPDIIAGIKADLASRDYTEQEIARRNVCSHGAVQYYKRRVGGIRKKKKQYIYERRSLRNEIVVRKTSPVVMNAMPWVTKEMLTGARAPIAKVRP